MLRTWLKRKQSPPGVCCTCYSDVDDGEDSSGRHKPPPPEGGAEKPILLPNEQLLQTFGGKRSMFKVSAYRVQTSLFECQVHNYHETDICESDIVVEANIDHLTSGAQPGAVHVTTERIVFIPVQVRHTGFSIQIEDITSMKVVGSEDALFDSSWFFVCYVGKYMSTIPFASEIRAQSFLKLISNIRFEHNVKNCLPPTYNEKGEEKDTRKKWVQADTKLPSYDESEHALKLFLVSKGLIKVDEPLDRHGQGQDLIAQARAPPTTPDPETRMTEILGGQTTTTRQHNGSLMP
ncbi:hypothetical protein TRICI_003028 [Trichomonascus ciferrii]|uniref:Uncharacterized protein n=1 Tax=Trichomonascus ciferrii TaxID=44093 RepID=A0A642V4C7_9ASCO|nr:hypothetical protein TRICI_003028 [Trichomonascus ciferrii]